MSIKISHHDRTVYVHDPDDTHSIIWFDDLSYTHDHSLHLGETIKVIGIDFMGVDEI
jgi:hypothetical protein